MRKAAALVGVLALVGPVSASADRLIVRKPAIRLLATAPITVRGVHFLRHERVRVTANSHVRIVRASLQGTFTAVFEGLVWDRCGDGLTIVASGSRGSEARLRLPAMECAPGLGP